MNKQLKLALIQMDVRIGEPDANFAKLFDMMERAVADPDHGKPDVILAPEMWNTGYALDRIHELADANGERTRTAMSAFCRKHGVNVVAGSIAYSAGDRVTNTILAFDRSGEEAAAYSKIHLFRLMEEEKYLTAGERAVTYELDGVPAGLMICYDIRFPELARRLALDGAKVLFVPAEWPKPRLAHWRTLLQARAIENQWFVVACNRTGISGSTEFFGHSMVIDPWGEVLAEGGETEAIIRAAVDLDQTDRVRSTIPVFEDRRPSLY